MDDAFAPVMSTAEDHPFERVSTPKAVRPTSPGRVNEAGADQMGKGYTVAASFQTKEMKK
jgi:hypothetical protein